METAYVFLADGFEEIEALTVVDVLRRAEIPVEMVSVESGEIIKGAHGISVLCDVNIDNCDFCNAGLLVLPGGMPGAATLDKDEVLRKELVRFAEAGKPLAAICAAPMVLGKLGLLKGKTVTCYPGFEQYLAEANYTAAPVEVDGHIITGNSPAAALPFALAIVEMLLGKDKVEELKQAMCVR